MNNFGIYRGRVIRNNDPEGLGRVTAQVPAVLGLRESEWAYPLRSTGEAPTPPDVGTPIWVLFENGEPSAPVWAGIAATSPGGATSTLVAWSRLTDVPATASRWPTWLEVTEKPTTFPTTWAQVSGAPATATRWPTWDEVTGKPTSYPTAWADVTGKPTALAYTNVAQTWTATQTFMAQSIALSALSATGTRDTTTFLRGDGTWAVVQTGAPANMVTTDTTQTISGGKTFTGGLSATTNITNGGFDFFLGTQDQTSRGNTGSSRALVKNSGGRLDVNFGNDFTGGTFIGSGTGTASWSGLGVRGTSYWGDGIAAGGTGTEGGAGTQYATIGAVQGLAGIMARSLHITWNGDGLAEIRYGRVGGTSVGTWWFAGPGTARGGAANVGNFAIGRGDGNGGGPSGNLFWVTGLEGESRARKGIRAANDGDTNTSSGVDLFLDSLFA